MSAHFLGRIRLLVRAAFLLSFLLETTASAVNRFATAGQTRPNFLFLFSDDQTYRALGLLGGLEVKTPNLDRLARRGMLFTHCFNQGGYSGAVCIPSRTMLNTGRHVWECRDASKKDVAEGAALWGETLGKAGYDTFMAGKWHIPDSALTRSFKTIGPLTGGFLASTREVEEAYHRPAPGNHWTPDDPKWNGHWLKVDGKVVHSSVRIADSAIDYLKTNVTSSANPFFMYVAFNAPHDPRQAPRQYLDLYPPATLKVPPNFAPKHPFVIDSYTGRDEILAPYPRTREIVQVHLQEYYAMITHLDAQIGRMLDALEETGKGANTIIIFTSDQGLAAGQHGLMGKQNLYEHSVRMPFIIAGPGIPAGKRNGALFNMQSLFATTCELAGISTPASVQFPSIVPLITGRKKELQEALYGAFLDRQRSVRTREWKLIRTPQEHQVQLFKVEADPWETNNLAADPEYARTLRKLDERLQRLMIEMKDPMSFEELIKGGKGREEKRN
ncbi:MAG: sulfatase [Verrucomicrobiales bacterium]|nr:sulfatase [Verrucomicrobiales bacterium]